MTGMSLLGVPMALAGLNAGFRFLVEEGILPREAYIPAVFGTGFFSHAALHRLGVVSTSPRAALRNLPLFNGFYALSHAFFEGIGMKPSPVRDVFEISLASFPYVVARYSPSLATALAPSSAAGGVSVLGAGAAFTRALGWIGLIDVGARTTADQVGWLLSAVVSGDTENNRQTFRRLRLSQDIYNQRTYDSFPANYAGTLLTFGDTVASWFDSDIHESYWGSVNRIAEEVNEVAFDFGRSVNENLRSIVLSHLSIDGDIDWRVVGRDIRSFYQDERNAENLKQGYLLIEDFAPAPQFTPENVGYLPRVVARDGEISDMAEFQGYLYRCNTFPLMGAWRMFQNRMIELELARPVDDWDIEVRIPENPTPAQAAFLREEYSALVQRVSSLLHLENALEKTLEIHRGRRKP